MAIGITIDFDLGGQFRAAMEKARLVVKDLSPALQDVADDFYEGQQSVFSQGPGPYPALSNLYAQRKQAQAGFVYPILVLSGALREAASVQDGSGNITKIQKQSVTFAVNESALPYAAVHQYGGRVMPKRSFMFVGPESEFANSNHRKRPERWAKILKQYVVKASKDAGFGSDK